MTDWKGIFLDIGIDRHIIDYGIGLFLKESLNNEQQHCGVFATFRNYIPVFQNAQFYALCIGTGVRYGGNVYIYCCFSLYLSGAFLTCPPLAYSLCFGANAIAIMLGQSDGFHLFP